MPGWIGRSRQRAASSDDTNTPKQPISTRRHEFVRGFFLALAAFTLVMLCGLLSDGGRRISRAQQQGAAAPTAPLVAVNAPTPEPTIAATTRPTMTVEPTVAPTDAVPTPTAPPAPTSPPFALTEAELLELAETAVGPSTLRDETLPVGQWSLRLGDSGNGPEAEVTVPLIQAEDNVEFVRLAKQRITQVVRALFVAEPNLARVQVTGTFPWGGLELPAVILVAQRSASNDWGALTATSLEAVAEKIEVKSFYETK